MTTLKRRTEGQELPESIEELPSVPCMVTKTAKQHPQHALTQLVHRSCSLTLEPREAPPGGGGQKRGLGPGCKQLHVRQWGALEVVVGGEDLPQEPGLQGGYSKKVWGSFGSRRRPRCNV